MLGLLAQFVQLGTTLAVSTNLFSTSIFQFLPYKWGYQYYFFLGYNINIWCLFFSFWLTLLFKTSTRFHQCLLNITSYFFAILSVQCYQSLQCTYLVHDHNFQYHLTLISYLYVPNDAVYVLIEYIYLFSWLFI